ncbi:MAG: CARDB domain-containing protein [Cellvibrionaceae bacterium]
MTTFTQSLIRTGLSAICALSAAASMAAPAQPDLIPITNSFAKHGKVMVKNIGKAKSRTSWLTIKCLANACPEHPSMAAYENPKFPNAVTIKVPALKAGGSFSHQLSFWKQLSFEPGQYKFLFLADAGKDIPESNEVNNKKVVVKKVNKPIDSFTTKTSPKSSKNLKASKLAAAKIAKSKARQQPSVQLHSQAGTQVGSQHSTHFGTGLGKADLTITPFYSNPSNLPEGFPTHSFCRKSNAGGTPKHLVFYIENIGNALATASEMKVMFNTFFSSGNSSTYTGNITPIAAGGKKYLSVPIPSDCYKPGFNKSCHFRIIADTAYEVEESNNVSNNFVDSHCVSAAG